MVQLLLFLMSLAAALIAFVTFFTATTVIHPVVGAALWVVAAVLFASCAIVDAVESGVKTIVAKFDEMPHRQPSLIEQGLGRQDSVAERFAAGRRPDAK